MYQSSFPSRRADEARAPGGGALAPDLFAAVSRLFRNASIGNAGYLADVRVESGLSGRETVFVHHGEVYRFACPFCGDSRARGWVSHLYGQPDPANPQRRMWRLAGCWNLDCFRDPGRYYDFRMILEGAAPPGSWFAEPDASRGRPPATGPARLPGVTVGLAEIPERYPARGYVRGRGFDPDVIAADYSVGYCLQAEDAFLAAEGRLIIPVFHGRKLVGWQGRKLSGGSKFKYCNMTGFSTGRYLYNFDRASAGRCVVLVEGAIHAWSVGRWAAATFGREVKPKQVELLAMIASREPLVVLFRDHGGEERMVAEANRAKLAALFPGRTLIVDPPENPSPDDLRRALTPGSFADAGDLTTEAAWSLIGAAGRAAGIDVDEFL